MSVTRLVFGSVAVKSRTRWLTDVRRPGAASRSRRHCRTRGMPYSPFRQGHEPAMRLRRGGLALELGQDLVPNIRGHAHHAIATRVVFTDGV